MSIDKIDEDVGGERAIDLRPITQREAFAFVELHHRHHNVPVGALWQHAIHDDAGQLVGVSVVGRPVARMLDDGLTCEITRLCTLGDANACSMLYGASRRASEAKGFRRGLTYILDSEFQVSLGASCRAAGYFYLGPTNGGSWSRPSRARQDDHPTEPKHKFGFGAWPADQIAKWKAHLSSLPPRSEAA